MRGKDPQKSACTPPLRIIPAGAGKRGRRRPPASRRPDHPRGCGEKGLCRGRLCVSSGSSPRVRGKVVSCVSMAGASRIIPAGAGKSERVALDASPRKDHPRGCGEKFASLSGFLQIGGSSPRVRGKAASDFVGKTPAGIIPAGAGKRAAERRPPPEGPGSSPRVRGKAYHFGTCYYMGGIIPAGAGKRACGAVPRLPRRDHPRGCGEKGSVGGPWRRALGSSPRVRGKVKMAAVALCVLGIIPAGAGKSRGPHAPSRGGQDHPRGCGEKLHFGGGCKHFLGSSPRVRGKVTVWGRGVALGGIIPAGAGKRRALSPLSAGHGDHPRGCGEKCE